MANMDETPLPFKFLNCQTYVNKESQSVQVRSTKSGSEKRQATINFGIFADGVM